jgi:Ca-activated chloride channel family protein
MTELEHFHFLRPAWLLLLPVVAWLWWQVRRRQDPLRGWRAWMDGDLLAALTVGGQELKGSHATPISRLGRSLRSGGFGLLAAWLMAVVAMAGPTWRPEPSPFADDPVPVMLVLNAGESMNLADLAPSRMERARLKIADFAAERRGQPLGLVVYAGSAHLVLPPTRDTAVVSAMAEELGPAVMPRPGNDLAAALRLAARTLGDSGGSIVVLTDTAPTGNESVWRAYRGEYSWPVHFLAVARPDSPEWDSLKVASAALGASLTRLTPDSADVLSLVRRTAKAPVAVQAAGEGTRWEEAGWWLVPLLALFALAPFRRVLDTETRNDASPGAPLAGSAREET